MNPVEISHVAKAFGNVQAVVDVSFEVRQGEIFGLLGPNGAGKTTTLRMLLDIFKPDAGAISILGGPMTDAKKNRIGYLPEDRWSGVIAGSVYALIPIVLFVVWIGVFPGTFLEKSGGVAKRTVQMIDTIRRGAQPGYAQVPPGSQ